MGVLYAKVAGQWVPIITAIEGSTGIQWPIQTKDPPLVIGASIDDQNAELQAFIQLDKFEMLPGTTIDDPEAQASEKYVLPRVLQWHPQSQYGPFWTFNESGYDAYLRDVNPDQDYTAIWSDWTGQLLFNPASGVYYSTTPGKGQQPKPEGGYVPWDQAWQYNMDAHWSYDTMNLGFGGFGLEHWQDTYRGYTDEAGDPYYQAGISDLWLGTGAYFELFTDSFGDHPRNDVEVMSAIWGRAYAGDITQDPRRPEVVIWARWEEGRDGHLDDLQEDLAEREVHFTSHNIHLYAGPIKRGLPDGQLNRGNIPVLAAVQGTEGTDSSPQRKQYYRQIGQQSVNFTDGEGQVVFPEEIWTGDVHPQAVVIGATVGGPMIAQVERSGGQLHFYLDRTFSGSLDVSWSVDYEEPVWSETRPVVGYIYVYGAEPTSGLRAANEYFLHSGTPILIPWGSGTVDLGVHGESYQLGLVVKDLSGATVGTVSEVSTPSGQDRFEWQLTRDLYPIGGGTTYRVVNPDGQESNWFALQWADIELPEG
jgi:hypothetical protein